MGLSYSMAGTSFNGVLLAERGHARRRQAEKIQTLASSMNAFSVERWKSRSAIRVIISFITLYGKTQPTIWNYPR